MKFVSIKTRLPKEEILVWLRDSKRTNEGIRFGEKLGTPIFPMKEKGANVSIGAKYIGGTTRDNGYLMGTKFYGKIIEKNGFTKISGIILTEPFLHLAWGLLIAFFVYNCFQIGGISIWPLCLVAMAAFLFYREYQKQGLIKRYISRAVRHAEKKYYSK